MNVLLSWSSGKDSAWTLHCLRQDPTVQVVGLLTTLNGEFDRVAMHAVRRSLLEAQAVAADLPVYCVDLPWPCRNEDYESLMSTAVADAVGRGVDVMAFGDLYLEDIRQYRVENLKDTKLDAIFPLWQTPTLDLAREMIDAGVVAYVTCIDPKVMPKTLVGRRFDHEFLDELPNNVDPCGENGEFHTFVSRGPMFAHDIEVEVGQTEERDGFLYADLLPL